MGEFREQALEWQLLGVALGLDTGFALCPFLGQVNEALTIKNIERHVWNSLSSATFNGTLGLDGIYVQD